MGFGSFEISSTELSAIEQSDRDTVIEQSHLDTLSLYYSTFAENNVGERKARLARKKIGIVKVDDFFTLNFWLSLSYALQQNRNPLSKILDLSLSFLEDAYSGYVNYMYIAFSQCITIKLCDFPFRSCLQNQLQIIMNCWKLSGKGEPTHL